MTRILLTGASGFIGRALLPLLLRGGLEVHTIGRGGGQAGATHHCVDLLDGTDCDAVRAIGATHLIHLAWYAEPGLFWSAPDNLDWVAASIRLVRDFVSGGGRRAVIAGSCAEYAWREAPLDEDAPIDPDTLYGAAKAALHDLLGAAAPTLGLSLAWARIFFPYGPQERPERLLGSLLAAIGTDRPARFSEGLQRRDFIHVEDVAAALHAILHAPIEGAVNVASGDAVSVRQFAETAAVAAGCSDRLAFGALPARSGEPAVIEALVDRLATTGYRPAFTLEAGLADAVARFRAGDVPSKR